VYDALTLAEPAEVPVNVAVQVAVPTGLAPWDRVQGEPVKPPAAVPVNVNATVPAGVDTVPALVAGSTTVAVQTEPCATRTVAGAQDTVVVVGRRLTVTVAAVVDELPV
jgi:hypothetical protein